jgi:Spy/CpxP family protein refolding chaperone
MKSESKYKILVWLVVILFAINISTVASLYFHTKRTEKPQEIAEIVQIDSRAESGTRQFRDKLDLDAGQVLQFREINQEYNRTANRITRQLEILRIDMVTELGKQDTNRERISEINQEFGQLHEQLKNLTADYYMQMKALCNEEQQQKLYELFRGMVQTDEPLPGGQGRRRGRAWR